MPYTDYPNVAAPSFWDQSRSGLIDKTPSQTFESLQDAEGVVEAPLDSIWTGSQYDLSGGSRTFLFVASELIEMQELYFLGYADITAKVWVFGDDGSPMDEYAAGWDCFDQKPHPDLPVTIYRFAKGWDENAPPYAYSGVRAIVISGYGSYQPSDFYGLYGIGELQAIPFWTGIEANLGWPFFRRMQEVF